MEIKTTSVIARQILRHRSFSFQEYSQRYADPTKDLGFVTREARLQDPKNRQNSVETEDSRLEEEWNMRQRKSMAEALISYRWAIDNGIAKEIARSVLPEGNTESVMIMAGSLRSFVHYIEVRHHPATQKEHRIVAEQISNIIIHHFPDIKEYLENVISNNYNV
jgi:thymidylate synthase (FAD)